eukprot:23383_1
MATKKTIRINDCKKEELKELPGISDTLAQRIITKRSTKLFESEDDVIDRVKGIGKGKMNNISEEFNIVYGMQIGATAEKNNESESVDDASEEPKADPNDLLESAKKEFVAYVSSVNPYGLPNENFSFTKKHAIKIHLSGKFRPQFNKYVEQFDAKAKWVPLNDTEKQSSIYKDRKTKIYFCNITIKWTTKHMIRSQDPERFYGLQHVMADMSLFIKLRSIGIPENDAFGWIAKMQKPHTPQIKNVSNFLDEKINEIKNNSNECEKRRKWNGKYLSETRGYRKRTTSYNPARAKRASKYTTRL